jgi:hypothetical protein
MIRHNQSKELVASMRDAGELAEALNHYEIQRIRWMSSHGEKMRQISQSTINRDGLAEQVRTIGDTLKNVLREVYDRTLMNAEMLGRSVKRGQEILKEVLKAKGLTQQYGIGSNDKAPSLFLDQRI